jgi:hypothetical protein
MGAINRTDLWQELNATDESFVRQKYAAGGYSPAKRRLVGIWLAERDAQQDSARRDEQMRAVQNANFWTRFTALATAAGVLATLALAAWPKH